VHLCRVCCLTWPRISSDAAAPCTSTFDHNSQPQTSHPHSAESLIALLRSPAPSCHPTVTVAALATGHVSVLRGLSYIAAQIGGAIAASALHVRGRSRFCAGVPLSPHPAIAGAHLFSLRAPVEKGLAWSSPAQQTAYRIPAGSARCSCPLAAGLCAPFCCQRPLSNAPRCPHSATLNAPSSPPALLPNPLRQLALLPKAAAVGCSGPGGGATLGQAIVWELLLTAVLVVRPLSTADGRDLRFQPAQPGCQAVAPLVQHRVLFCCSHRRPGRCLLARTRCCPCRLCCPCCPCCALGRPVKWGCACSITI
jgi:hypothetical protein